MTWSIEDGIYNFCKEELVRVKRQAAYGVVADVAAYPEFLPDVAGSRVEGDLVEMSLKVGPLTIPIRCRMEAVEDREIRFTMVEGPLRSFTGHWQFSDSQEGTIVTVGLRFEPGNLGAWIARMARTILESKTQAIISAFQDRLQARESLDPQPPGLTEADQR